MAAGGTGLTIASGRTAVIVGGPAVLGGTAMTVHGGATISRPMTNFASQKGRVDESSNNEMKGMVIVVGQKRKQKNRLVS